MDELIRHGGDIYGKGPVLDFSANINPLGMPESVKGAAAEAIERCAAYPDPLCRELRTAIGRYHGLPAEDVVCGNGAADVIFRLVLAVKPKKALVVSPTFSEYESALSLAGCRADYLDLKAGNGFKPELPGEIPPGTDLVFFCNPNNPTGFAAKAEFTLALGQKCARAGALLVADECFSSFVEHEAEISAARYLSSNKNLFILKAFTKMYAMAGIRLGYGLCGDAGLIRRVALTGQPWSVSTVASKCGEAALRERDFVKATVSLIAEERAYLESGLKACGFKVYPSAANYILFHSGNTGLCGELEARGFLIRSCANYRGLDAHYYRIAVKSHEDNMKLMEALGAAVHSTQ